MKENSNIPSYLSDNGSIIQGNYKIEQGFNRLSFEIGPKLAENIPNSSKSDKNYVGNAIEENFVIIVIKQMCGFMEKNKFLYKLRFEFRKNHNTIQPLIHFLGKIYNALNKDNPRLLTQIRNIRKMILCSLYAAACFKMCESFSVCSVSHVTLALPSPPPPSLHLPALSQLETLKTFTTPSQPWLLHDGDSDTELTADTAYI